MKVIETKKYFKSHKKTSTEAKDQVKTAIEVFKKNPFDKKLYNHPLKGKMLNLRAFSAANDLRIIYREEGGHIIIIMIDVGSHAQVY